MKDTAGRANVAPSDNPADEVWGVIFEIPDAEIPALDKAEGRGYERRTVEATPDGEPTSVVTYIAKPEAIDDTPAPPSTACRRIIGSNSTR